MKFQEFLAWLKHGPVNPNNCLSAGQNVLEAFRKSPNEL
jgi:hypothetical protein